MEFGQLQTRSGKLKKSKFDELLLLKKYIPSHETLRTENLSNIAFKCFCKIPNYLCHF